MSNESTAEAPQMVNPPVAPHTSSNLAAMMEEGRAPSSDSSEHNHESTPEGGLRHSAQLEKGPKVKITLWRLLNTILLLGLGIYKATAAYRGQQVAPTTLDWIMGVLWAVIAYWVSFMEEAHLGPRGRWFFAQDHSAVVLLVLTFSFALSIPFCATALFWHVIASFTGEEKDCQNDAFWVVPLAALVLICSGCTLNWYEKFMRRQRLAG
ncbi:hypothetical protein B0H12DRAFT_1221502 [Mycena haematopus]|nr:hypothetical protein B0H12DRAFT_1221502 [Mycena haematopus]